MSTMPEDQVTYSVLRLVFPILWFGASFSPSPKLKGISKGLFSLYLMLGCLNVGT